MAEAKEVLTREFAKKRKEQVDDITYNLFLNFDQNKESYGGVSKIRFLLKKKQDGILLESVSKVKKLLVNGKQAKFEKGEFSIKLNDGLVEGNNEVEIEYEGYYDHSGLGVHKFSDPEDGKTYIYTHFEPYDAHKMMPCFDQPDLKAILELSVQIPSEWVAISNEYGNEKINGSMKTVTFNPTKKLSTYLFEIAVGNYEFVEDSYEGMKIRIYFRNSWRKHIPYKEMFTITKQGLGFYEKFFNMKYPFSKYDQIFVPEFNYGAMEQPGAVTFAEHYLERRSMTHTERADLAITVIHEMAHMWFGDLVTMKWWDDLWLNESFADLMGYFVLAEATEFKDAWENFNARKMWGYTQDQYSTTHPILANAEDTDIAFSLVDGITYAKGASVLKQLMFYIGKENFQKGVIEYFKKYQWQNTELRDFLECMEKSSGKDLKKWFGSWIETTGVNSTSPKISHKDGKVSEFKIIQEPSKGNGILRQHKTKIAIFNKNSSKPQTYEVTYEGKETNVKEIMGIEKPDFVFLNYGDYDYAKDRFEKDSLEFAFKKVQDFKDELLKQMTYGSMWQMVRDAELDPRIFLDLILKNSPKENNLLSLERMVLRVKTTLHYYVGGKTYDEYSQKFFDLALKMLSSDMGAELKNAWFTLFVSLSTAVKGSAEKLVEVFNGKTVFKNFEFDQDKKWSIVARLEALNDRRADEFLEMERKNDKSDRGEKMAAIAEASSLKNKEKFWKLYVSGEGKSLDFIRDAMAGFFLKNQKEELRKYIPLFFEGVEKVFLEKDNYYSKAFFGHLFPIMYVENETLKKTKSFLKEHGDAHKLLKKDLMEGIDDLERSLKILEKYP